MSQFTYRLGCLSPIYRDPETGILENSTFISITNWEKTSLVCDANTKVVYYAKNEDDKIVATCPYLSENGKPCRLSDKGKIVEII